MDNLENKVRAIKYLSGVNLLVGIWLLFAAFVFGGIPSSAWNDVFVGLAVITLSIWHITKPEVHGASWTNALLGAWMLLVPALIQYPVVAHIWNEELVGLILVVFGSWAAMIRTTPRPMQHQPHAG